MATNPGSGRVTAGKSERRLAWKLRAAAAVLAAATILAPAHVARAQGGHPADGTVVEESACPPRPSQTYELVMYSNDGHGLPMNRRDADGRVIDWFRKHIR